MMYSLNLFFVFYCTIVKMVKQNIIILGINDGHDAGAALIKKWTSNGSCPRGKTE